MIEQKALLAAIERKLKKDSKERIEKYANEYVSDFIHGELIACTEALKDDGEIRAIMREAVAKATDAAIKEAVENIKVEINIDAWVND